MYLLDDLHRNYINQHIFSKNDIVAIKSVAGSGKTTTLLNLSKTHSRVLNTNDDDDKYEDDLPKFLTTISIHQLEELIDNITKNIVKFEDSKIKLYTTHSYKGTEDNNIRLANDIIIEDENIYYVSITRGTKKILIDE